ncbi:Ceramide synthase 2 [Varanus komodoensis]|nr:Ceramide synthase 2 [Varanus komodoensis]
MLQTLHDYFWWDRLWLPANLTWADLKDQDGRASTKASDLYITIPLAFLFLVIRHLFEMGEADKRSFVGGPAGCGSVRWGGTCDGEGKGSGEEGFAFERRGAQLRQAQTYVATPLAGLLNVKEKVRLKATPNPVLEKFYTSSCKHPKQADVEALAKKSGYTTRQVERWFRRRRNQDRPSLLKKFRESSWRFTFYLLAFIAGMAVITDKPWFYNLREVWEGYPVQDLLPSQYWYYMIELSFYLSLLFSVASDVKRKDFREQIIHHVATIILISFSWFTNYIRAGTLIMALHDSSDYLLESAKMFNYAGWKNTCNGIFIIFAVVFIITRLIILPFCACNVFNLDFPSLDKLDCTPIVHNQGPCWLGKVVEDERSDRDETDETEEEEPKTGAGAGAMADTKNGPLTNGHPILNNNHRKAE